MILPDRVCFIIDRFLLNRINPVRSNGLFDLVSVILESGIRWIQYRDKNVSRAFIFNEAMRLRELTQRYKAMLIINDHPDIAVAVGAEGVHLGQEDMPIKAARKVAGNKIIGISTHSLKEAIDAEKKGADYIGFGPVFMTTTKDAGPPKGTELLKEIKRNVKIPVVAIGGINAENLTNVFEAGADAVAVASGLISGNVKENIERFLRIRGGL